MGGGTRRSQGGWIDREGGRGSILKKTTHNGSVV